MGYPGWILAAESFRIACVGDNITYGAGIENRERDCYPRKLKELLGDGTEVGNFGIPGATLVKHGDLPYWKQEALTKALDFRADLVVILLGTNDSKPQNWVYRGDFQENYLELIALFKSRKTAPDVVICLPPPAYSDAWGIRGKVIKEEVIPFVQVVAATAGVGLIDLHTPFLDQPELLPDTIHPGPDGATVIARAVGEFITERHLSRSGHTDSDR